MGTTDKINQIRLRIDNIMAKRKETTRQTMSPGSLEGKTVPVLLVAPVVLFLLQTRGQVMNEDTMITTFHKK